VIGAPWFVGEPGCLIDLIISMRLKEN